MRPFPLPEILAPARDWIIRSDVAPHVDIEGRSMSVPLGRSQHHFYIRSHEMVHVLISPPKAKWPAERLAYLDAVEEARVNSVLERVFGINLTCEKKDLDPRFRSELDAPIPHVNRGAAALLSVHGRWAEWEEACTHVPLQAFTRYKAALRHLWNGVPPGYIPPFERAIEIARWLEDESDQEPPPPSYQESKEQQEGEEEKKEKREGEEEEKGEGEEEGESKKATSGKEPTGPAAPFPSSLQRAGGKPRRTGEEGSWVPCKIVANRTPLPALDPKEGRRRRRSSDEGSVPNAMWREEIDGAIFQVHKKGRNLSVLVDASGSMRMRYGQLQTFLNTAPASTIAFYSGNYTGAGSLEIVASKGRKVSREVFQAAWRRKGPFNLVDFPALQWLSRQRPPRIWISDGVVTWQSYRRDVTGREPSLQCLELCIDYNIHQWPSLELALTALQNGVVAKSPGWALARIGPLEATSLGIDPSRLTPNYHRAAEGF